MNVHHSEGVAVIRLGTPGSPDASLTEELLEQLAEALHHARQDSDTTAVVIMPGNSGPHPAGAGGSLHPDKDAASPGKLAADGQRLFTEAAGFPKPVVAALDGDCAGWRTELALACRYRLLSSSDHTSVSLPAVKLGLLPALGGTQRLPRLVGLELALDLLLSGRRLSAPAALESGFADALHHPEGLEAAAVRAARELAAGGTQERPAKRSVKSRLLDSFPFHRFVYRRAEEQLEEDSEDDGHASQPAPARIIETVRHGLRHGSEAGLKAEREAFSDLSRSPEARALAHVSRSRAATLTNPVPGAQADVQRIAVAAAGYTVRLSDDSLEQAAAGRGRAWEGLDADVGSSVSEFGRDQAFERIRLADGAAAAAAGAELTIEAAPESLELKRQLLSQVEAVTPDDHVYATSTSSLPLHEITAGAARPGQVVGMHYFAPAARSPLLELVRSEKTTDRALATAAAVGLRQGKALIVVADRPGFYVNRILAPYMSEAVRLVQSGVSVDQVDSTMRSAGFPLGPLQLLDAVGLDVADSVNSVLAPLFAGRGLELTDTQALTAAGLRGRRSGAGFYRYGHDGKTEVNEDVARLLAASAPRTVKREYIRERLLFALVNEAVRAYSEGVIDSMAAGDAGAVLGCGFSAFLGGPFRFAEDLGLPRVLEMLDRLRDAYGKRFEAAPLLRELVEQGAGFQEKAG